ncbi:MAG: hypothetical protein GX138_07460 [Firmicutes bacterium]|jgi:uncharacterized membrane protein|nr:hypothetical protein [Bacillota bacterium]
MAKQNKKSRFKSKQSEKNKEIKGNLIYFILILYLISSLVYYFWPVPFVPLITWLLSLFVFQFSKNSFLRIHAIQSASINLLFVFLVFAQNIIRSLIQPPAFLSQALLIIIVVLQVWGAESGLRGRFTQIPFVFSLARKQAALFFGEEDLTA